MNCRAFGLAVMLCAGQAASVALAQSGPLRPVAMTGTDGALGPGLGSGVVFASLTGGVGLGGASLANGGNMTFIGVLSGPGVNAANNRGVWAVRAGGAPGAVARAGAHVPDQPAGVVFNEFYTPPQISDAGNVVFQGSVAGGKVDSTKNDCLFSAGDGAFFTLIRERVTLVPDSDPVIAYGDSQNPSGQPWGNNRWVLNRNGATALRCFVDANGGAVNSHFGVWLSSGGAMTKHYRGGDVLPSEPSRLFFGCGNPAMNDSGAIITMRLDTASGSGIWSNRALDGMNMGITGTGPLHAIAMNGAAAPGTSATFTGFSSVAINKNGRVAFVGSMPSQPTGPGGVWSDGRFGVLQPVVLSGFPAPGTNGALFHETFGGLANDIAMADNNVCVVAANLQVGATVSAGNDSGIWSNRSLAPAGSPVGNLRLVVREGDPTPASAGPDFIGLNFGVVGSYWVNAAGRVAFICAHNDFTRAMWIEQADGSLAPVVKEFTMLDIYGDGSDVRLVTGIEAVDSHGATGDGRRVAFNDENDVAVRVTFVDGSQGIFTTAAYAAASPDADFNDDTMVNSQDFFDFLTAFFAGC